MELFPALVAKPINPTHIIKNPWIILPSPEQWQPQNSINGLFEIQAISTLKLRDHDGQENLDRTVILQGQVQPHPGQQEHAGWELAFPLWLLVFVVL